VDNIYVIVCEFVICVKVSEQRSSIELRKGEAVIAHTMYESFAAVTRSCFVCFLIVFCLWLSVFFDVTVILFIHFVDDALM